MSADSAKKIANKYLVDAGIKINGKKPWDIKVHNDKAYERILSQGTLGVGESYMDGWWDCDALDELVARVARPGSPIYGQGKLVVAKEAIKAMALNPQSFIRAKKNMDVPYDTIGEDLFKPMLGRTMAYTCGYWKDAKTLDAAQDAKFDLVCRKLGLKKGMTLLDIGCGWGQLLLHAQKHYGAKVTGITISKEHVAYLRKYHPEFEVLEMDYRKLEGRKFDRVASVGMFEHVGPKNYKDYFKAVSNLLEDDGLHLMHCIAGDKSTHHVADAWFNKYIFPGGRLPSAKQVTKAFDGIFLLEDWHNFGFYYDKTLMAWMHNFDKAWPKLKDKYGDRFYRMWRFYLLSCAGAFRNRHTNLWQIVLSKNGVDGGYTSIR